MGKKKKKKGAKKYDKRHVAALARLMMVEQRLYEIWEERSDGEMNWVGELLGFPAFEHSELWLAAIGDRVAALGGHIELVAVFPDESVTLLIEPGLDAGNPPNQ